ncbi:Vta1 like-domain-containing protein [Haematococcus lacustris]
MPELSFEEQKKAVVPFLQRAQEIANVDPKVAFYCRMYAVDQALQLEKRHKDINGLVASTLASLEKSKLTLTLDQESDRYHCESFALKIFSNADRTDRAGRADVNTAKAFFAASFFLEILNQFGPLDADLLGKQRYAAWRATEIRKAIREGRPPLPPPSSDAAQAQQAAGGEAFNLEPGSSLPPANLAPGPPDAAWNSDPTTLNPSSPSQAFAAETEAAAGAAQEGGEGGWAEGAHGPGTPPQGMGAPYGGLQGNPPDPAVGQAERPSSNGPGREGGEGDRGQGGGALAGQRFARGSPVLFCAEPGRWHPERGTVGQVLGPGGPQGCRYTVALPHVFVEAADAQLAPAPPEGAQLYWRSHPQQPGVGVWMLQVKDEASWPPSYLVCFPDGSERIAEAHQLSFLPDPPQLSQPPPIPGPGAEHASQPLPGWLMQDSQSPFGNPQPPQPPAWGGGPPLVPAGPGSRGGDHAGVNAAAHNQGHPGLAPTPPPPRPTSTLTASPSPSKPAIYGASSNLPTTGPANPPLPSPPCTQSSRGGPAAAGPVPLPTPAMAMQAGGHGGAGQGVWVPALPPGHKPSLAAITEAQKAARVAISSLNFEDAASAVKHLTQAIALLTKV